MARMHYDADADLGELAGKTVAVLGFGSQGRAQALNLRDSGIRVLVGLRLGSRSRQEAEKEGFEAFAPAEAVRRADLVAMLVPDTAQAVLYREAVSPHLKAGAALLFSHGFNVRFGQIQAPPTADVVMIAPKAPGPLVRDVFAQGGGVPCLLAVHQDATGRAKQLALAYAKAIGGTRAGVLETSFAEETETDLFGEQAVLCGGVTALIKAGFETLTEAGYQPEVAYFECLHELKLIVDLMHRGGLAGMRQAVSETAKYGDLTRGGRVVDERVKASMKRLLEEIRSGAFAREWVEEDRSGRPRYSARLKEEAAHPIEKVGAALRQRMSWLQANKPAETAAYGRCT